MEPLSMSDLITLQKGMIFAGSMGKQAFSVAESCVTNANFCDHLVGGFIRFPISFFVVSFYENWSLLYKSNLFKCVPKSKFGGIFLNNNELYCIVYDIYVVKLTLCVYILGRLKGIIEYIL